ncbi:MAG TPA: exodeoxyribonuclease VII small subunit [Phycisphaerae bacterium]|nr:exodeoxyribonuclease VII small subunit [Phycisphaerae bacterium]
MAEEKTKQKLKFEEALAKLERIVTEIEAGKVPLEESIEKYAEGIELVKHCRKILDAAEQKIQLLTKAEGETLEPGGQLPDAAAEQ